MNIAEQINTAKSPTEINRETIRLAIACAGDDISKALSAETYKALAALKSDTATHGEYVQAIADLKEANKAISRRDIDEGIKSAADREPLDQAASELRDGVEVWDSDVDGSILHSELCTLFTRHCVLPSKAAPTIAAWVMGAYAIDSFRIFPKLLIHSPQKRCGKSRVLEVLASVMPRALIGSNVTPSVIFRAIEMWGVSILLDEVDTFIHQNDDLRGIVNSGHTRASAYVWRVEGEAVREPMQFSTWAPMALAMIGNPPGTILDRSIKVGLKRKRSTEAVERIPQSLNDDNLVLRRKLARWANDNADALKQSEPSMPAHDNDRASDNWTALYKVADLVGVRAELDIAMRNLETDDGDSDDLSIELLRDIHLLINNNEFVNRIFSGALTELLVAMEDRPWPECNKGRPLTANRLAYLLKPYGIKSRTLRIGTGNKKGYEVADFNDAITRYLNVTTSQDNGYAAASVTDSDPVTVLNCHNVTPKKSDVTDLNRHVTFQDTQSVTPQANENGACDVVTEEAPLSQGYSRGTEIVL